MAQIQVFITVTKTVSTADGATFEAVRTWVKTNVRDKLPADASMTENYNITP